MKYWAHINNELKGPFEKEEVKALQGFGPGTLICPEATSAGEAQEWKPASGCPDFFPGPAAPKPAQAESPLAMTMRGTLIEPADGEASAPEPPKPAQAESPLAMTMRGTLIEPADAGASKPAPPAPKPSREPEKRTGAPAADLASLAEGQARLLERVERVEKLLVEMRSLLFPGLDKKN